jgi:hypothetical protein
LTLLVRAAYARGAMRVISALCAASALVWAASARADEPKLKLMRETTSYTDVIDAFDGDDPFDLNAQINYSRTSDTGTIKREYTSDGAGKHLAPIADSERVTSTLTFELDVGLWHDLMAYLRVPLIVSDARNLTLPSNSSQAAIDARLRDPNGVQGGMATDTVSLFDVPFESPTRAGFDYVAIGGAWAILNQQRQPWLPNWVLMLEGRRAVGSPLKPCRIDEAGDTVCGSQIAGMSTAGSDGTNHELAGKSAGSSRGLSGVQLETRLSRRYRYAEPYGGLAVLVEWPSTADKYFNPGGRLDGVMNSLPPRQATATLGTAVIPWENRARYQRFALDLRLNATYYTEGRDYTALYDALGTSSHAELARSNYEGVRGVLDPNANTSGLMPCGPGVTSNCYLGSEVPFYGLTDVQSHLKYGFRVGLEMQAAQYVRFAFGSGFSWVTAHALTMADACNPDVVDPGRSESYRGATCADASGKGIVNPAHRPTIDLPGRRFWMTGELVVDLYATATAQF